MISRPNIIALYGDVSSAFVNKVSIEFSHMTLKQIPTNAIIEFDKAIHEASAVIISSNQKDNLSFITAYLAEWRVLGQELQKDRPIIIDNRDGAFDSIFEALKFYRANLIDEKNPEAKNWFVYPTKQLADFFTVCHTDDAIITALKNILSKQLQMKNSLEFPQEEWKKLSEKFSKANIFESIERYHAIKENKKPGIFVPTFACDNEYLDDIAKSLGKIIANLGFKFINGGPDGGRKGNGPMRHSALGAKLGGAPILSIYSLPILTNYVSAEKLDQFEDITILATVSEGERKQMMLEESAAVIALPGAIGTIAEIEDAIRLGKPTILVDDKSLHNGSGFWGIHLAHFKRIGLEDKIVTVNYGQHFSIEIIRTLRAMNVIFPKDAQFIQESSLYKNERIDSINQIEEQDKINNIKNCL